MADIRASALKLLTYCEQQGWAGYDPYDALNSRVIEAFPILNFKLPRLMFTQLMKRSPINFRPLLLVPKTRNPKGTALFISALIKLARTGLVKHQDTITDLARQLINSRTKHAGNYGWGYNFPWQSRTALVPKGSPNVICTTFAAHALLDAHEFSGDPLYLEAANEAARFLVTTLYREKPDSVTYFSYTPMDRPPVHNANLLGAAFLSRVSQLAGETDLLRCALKAARYSVKRQLPDGSWKYGELPSQSWIDNFHTGYNLCALRQIGTCAGTSEFEPSIRAGFQFYRSRFFEANGLPKYFHDKAYPVDAHSVAQSILTLTTFSDLDEGNDLLAQSVLRWAMRNLWDPQGFFYYQKGRFITNKIPYMRWSQAWMLLALASLLEAPQKKFLPSNAVNNAR